MNLKQFKFFKPPRKKIDKLRLYKEMLREAIAIIVLETDATSEASVRMKIKNTVAKRLNNKI